MTSDRTSRIILGSCIPPALGGLIFYAYLFFFDTTPSYSPEWNNRNIINFIPGYFFIVLLTSIFFGIQSFFYSLLMELAVQKINNDKLVIFISMLLGTLVTSLFPSFFGSKILIIGGVVGLITGYFLRRLIKLQPANPSFKRDA